MLLLYQSNRIEVLADALAEAMRAQPAAALVPETVVVQSSAMARWLSFALAERLGVAANVDFRFPASYIWSLFGSVLPEVAPQSPFEPEVLRWTFLRLLEDDEDLPRQPRLAHYLREADARQRYELACRLAEVYDRYLVYRPDWIAAWSEERLLGLGPDEAWQALLWRRAAPEAAAPHPREQFYAAIDSDPAARARLPRTLHLFAITALPPMYLDVFARLAAHVDVHLYALNPCREYWGDIVRRRVLARQAAGEAAPAPYAEVGNSLLASLGLHGCSFFDALAELQAHQIERYVAPQSDTLLATLQRDILELRERGEAGVPRARVEPQDDSLQVHVCHGPLREVEVLHDRLLDAFERDPTLQPGEVLVLVPQLERYAPAIEAVFATAPEHLRIPYSIADRGLVRESAVVRAFAALLDAPQGRMETESVLALLEHAPIAARYGIDADALAQLRAWLRETGVRWGYDESARAALGLPATREHTWRAGLDRLLLGYALPGESLYDYAGVLPYGDVEGSEAVLAGRLQSFVEALHQHAEESQRTRTFEAWRLYTDRLLGEFFALDETQETEAQRLRAAAQALCDQAARAGYAGEVSYDVWRTELLRALEPLGGAYGFLAGGVTFAALQPMRPVPARIVVLLGMNDGDYPSAPRAAGFDLTAEHPRRGDRVRRDEERYAFLEALLAAREKLYISYTGRSVGDNSPLPPSPLVSELMEAVRRGFEDGQGGDPLARLVIEHPLQAFSPRYFDGSDARLYSYQEAYASASRALGRETPPRPFVSAPLTVAADPQAAEISLERLQRFLGNPARHFLRERLGINLAYQEEAVPDTEPFVLDGLASWRLAHTTFARRLAGIDATEALRLARAEGLLPHGAMGEVEYAALSEKLEPLVEAVRAHGSLRSEAVVVDLGDCKLVGTVSGLDGELRVEWRTGPLRAVHRLETWVRHLACNAALGPRPTRLYALDGKRLYAPVEDAVEQLRALVGLLRAGEMEPLPFFPRTSGAYAEKAYTGEGDPRYAARRQWEANEYGFGESQDAWFALAFRGRDPLDEAAFEQLAIDIYFPLLEAES